MKPELLLIDDDKNLLEQIAVFLRSHGFEVDTTSEPRTAYQYIKRAANGYALVLLDLNLGKIGLDGTDVLKKIKRISPNTAVAIWSGDLSQEATIETLRAGADDWIPKRTDPEDFLSRIKCWIDRYKDHFAPVGATPEFTGSEIETTISKMGLVGNSVELARAAASGLQHRDSHRNVMLVGETGTGKELFAKAIHYNRGKFLAVNCSMLDTPGRQETTLFGHKKGSFTGASSDQAGVFESAEGGTVFLDEIDYLKPETQAKLLRVIQERKVLRHGDTKEREVKFRLITATKPNIRERIRLGQFLPDLFFRIRGVEIDIPPLRERLDDIEPLLLHFTSKWNRENGTTVTFRRDTLNFFKGRSWPGNVRELENLVTLILDESGDKNIIAPTDLHSFLQKEHSSADGELRVDAALETMERQYIYQALGVTSSVRDAEAFLGWKHPKLRRRMRALGISRTDTSVEGKSK